MVICFAIITNALCTRPQKDHNNIRKSNVSGNSSVLLSARVVTQKARKGGSGLCISCRASEPKRQKHEPAQKGGFPLKFRKSAKKCSFVRFLALFLESAETPLFVQINVFAVWALRLDRKYIRSG